MDQVTTTTAPFPSTPVRQFSFTDFSVNNPTTPQPGDRIDSEYDRTNASTAQIITWASVSLNTDGTIRAGAIGQDQLVSGLFDDIAQGIIDDVQPLVDEATGAANSALASSHTAQAAATAADTSNVQAQGAAAAAQTAATSAANSVTTAQTYAFNAQTAATDAGNAGNHADGAAALAQDYADVTEAWAEHMPDTIPPNILAVMGITGDHWSSRWWANKAEAAVGGLTTTLYVGAWPTPPTTTVTGDPLTVGAIYYNTVLQQPFVWNGSAWVPFYAPTKALLLTLLYRAAANQTVFPLTTPDLGGQTYGISPVTPEPVEAYVNGVRVPQDDPNPGSGDWTLNAATSTITFLRPLLAGSMVQVDVMTPASALAPTRVQTQAVANIDLDPATGNPGQIDGVRTTFPLIFIDGAHTPVNPGSAQELFISLDGVVQQPNIAYTVSAGNIVFTEPPALAAVFWGYWYGPGLSGSGPGAGFLPITGGTLTGPLTLSGPPTVPLNAANKGYVDGLAGGGPFLPLTGGTLTGPLNYTATGGTTSRSAQNRAADVANVLDYGAGIGGDDAAAIRAAIASGKDTVLIPPGSYTMKSAVSSGDAATNPICLLFSGVRDLCVIAYGAIFTTDNSLGGTNAPGIVHFDRDSKHCQWLGGTFVGNPYGLTTSQENTAFSFNAATDITVRDVKSTGSFLTTIAGVWMFDCTFENIQAFNNANALDMAHIENVTFRRCRFSADPTRPITGANVHYDLPTAGSNSVTTETGAPRNLRTGCTNDLRFLECLFDGFGNGIAIDCVQGALISRTVCRNGLKATSASTQAGVTLYRGSAAVTAGLPTNDITLDDCDIYNNGATSGGPGSGVIVAASSGTIGNVTLANCRIYDNATTGVYSNTMANVVGLSVVRCDFASRTASTVQTLPIDAALRVAGSFQSTEGNLVSFYAPPMPAAAYTVEGTTAAGANDADSKSSVIRVTSNTNTANVGGAIEFGSRRNNTGAGVAGSGYFASVKGELVNGANNTIGNLAVWLRAVNTDTGLTKVALFTSTGLNSCAIGATTPSAGTFTNFAASGTVSGAGFTNLLAPYMPLSGGTLTGPLTLSAAATISSPSAAAGSNGNGTDISITAGARDGTGVNGNIWLHTTTSGNTFSDSHFQVGTFASQKFLTCAGPVGTNRALRFTTSVAPGEAAGTFGAPRWQIYANGTAEGGSNAGSDLDIGSYTDAGAFISGSVVRITRSTGLVTCNFGLTSIGVTTLGSASNNRLTITPGAASTNPIIVAGSGTGGTQMNGTIGFNSTAPIAKPTVTGAKGSNAALGSLIAALVSYGLITDTTSA